MDSTVVSEEEMDSVPGQGPTPNIQFIIIYDVLWASGFVLLSIIFLTVLLSPRVKRTPLWITGVAGWVTYSLSMLILLGEQNNKSPPYALCLAQAAMIYLTPVFTAFSVVACLLQAYWQICRISTFNATALNRIWNIWFYMIPIVPATVVLIVSLITGLQHPEAVQKDVTEMYCHITFGVIGELSASLVIVAMLAICICEGLILRLILRTNGVYGVSRSVVIRMASFTVCVLVIVGISALQYFPATSVIVDHSKVEIIQGTTPCIAALAFGTTRDFFDVWLRRRKRIPDVSHCSPENSSKITMSRW